LKSIAQLRSGIPLTIALITHVVLGILIVFAMNGKSVTGPWKVMQDIIKVAVTIWPIMFAAVVAQAFKTWATWKVERGVKLGELEQLVGSNSFGAAMKQPFLLRSLDVLTVTVFAVWCLSPIGSQALQRTYDVAWAEVTEPMNVSYLQAYGNNRLLSPQIAFNATEYSLLMQSASVYYISTFMPLGPSAATRDKNNDTGYLHDQFGFPLLRGPVMSNGSWTESGDQDYRISAYGVPVGIPASVLQLADSSDDSGGDSSDVMGSESVSFQMNSSYFNLTCADWQNVTFAQLNTTSMPWSVSETLAINFTNSTDNATIASLGYATLTDAVALAKIRNESQSATTPQNGWEYSYITCDIEQVFVTANVSCWVDTTNELLPWGCVNDGVQKLDRAGIAPSWQTNLTDFSFLWASTGSPADWGSPTTPSKFGSIRVLASIKTQKSDIKRPYP
jgi:hypothetical protein